MCFGFVFLDFMCLGLAEIQVWGSSVDVGFVFCFAMLFGSVLFLFVLVLGFCVLRTLLVMFCV